MLYNHKTALKKYGTHAEIMKAINRGKLVKLERNIYGPINIVFVFSSLLPFLIKFVTIFSIPLSNISFCILFSYV